MSAKKPPAESNEKNFAVLDFVERNDCQSLSQFCDRCPLYGHSLEKMLETPDIYGNTALLKACYLGNLSAACILLKNKANVAALNYFGQNALTLATYSGNYMLICELLKYRTYEDFGLSSMIPPLFVATMMHHRQLIDFFQKSHTQLDELKSVHGLSLKEYREMVERNNDEKIS